MFWISKHANAKQMLFTGEPSTCVIIYNMYVKEAGFASHEKGTLTGLWTKRKKEDHHEKLLKSSKFHQNILFLFKLILLILWTNHVLPPGSLTGARHNIVRTPTFCLILCSVHFVFRLVFQSVTLIEFFNLPKWSNMQCRSVQIKNCADENLVSVNRFCLLVIISKITIF